MSDAKRTEIVAIANKIVSELYNTATSESFMPLDTRHIAAWANLAIHEKLDDYRHRDLQERYFLTDDECVVYPGSIAADYWESPIYYTYHYIMSNVHQVLIDEVNASKAERIMSKLIEVVGDPPEC